MSTPRAPSRRGFDALAARTPARVAVGRAGPRLRWTTRAALVIGDATAYDVAREAVSRGVVSRLRLVELATLAASRQDALDDPRSAQRLDPRARARLRRCRQRPDVQLVVCDGLAPSAVAGHARPLLTELTRLLRARHWRSGTPIFVRNARTAVVHEIMRALRPRALCLLIGQRPGTLTPSALTALLLPGRSSVAALTLRDIHHAGAVNARAAARRLVEALDPLLGDARSARGRRRPVR